MAASPRPYRSGGSRLPQVARPRSWTASRPVALLVAVGSAWAALDVAAFVVGSQRSSRVPSLRSGSARLQSAPRLAAAPAGVEKGTKEEELYDWQVVVGESSGKGQPVIPMSDLPDLPDFETEDTVEATPGLTVKTNELPELPEDIMPPEPTPWTDGGYGFWEWTAIWCGIVFVVLAFTSVGSYFFAKIPRMEPAEAATLTSQLKVAFGALQVLFFARIMLTQFPKIDTTEYPWAIFHYPTEWVLQPVREVFKPEAGVDIAPVVWFMIVSFFSEIITGPAGILHFALESKTVAVPGMM